jgi:hypothetical protein
MGIIFLAIALIASLVLLTSAYQAGRNRGFREGCAYGRDREREDIIIDDEYARHRLTMTAEEVRELV